VIKPKNMQSIAEFIVNNIDINHEKVLHHSVIQNGIEMDMGLNDMGCKLLKVINKNEISEFTLFPENLGIQRKKIITFKWRGKKCEIGEHFDTQRNYFSVKMSPVI